MPTDLPAPLPRVVAAPMAGGPSTPELVNAVSFGFLAWGTCSLEQAREELARVKEPFGINLFYPQTDEPAAADLERLSAELGEPVPSADLTFGFRDKLRLTIEDGRAAIVSSTFGSFTPEEVSMLHDAGIQAWVTVTNEADAVKAAEYADGLIVQGPEAGGHRATWRLGEEPGDRSVEKLLDGIFRLINIPLMAAGGARGPADVERLIEWGASSVACGSAFLLADEAGTSDTNRAHLRDARTGGERSVSTRAFSGRYARGLETEFTRTHPDLPPTYPHLNAMLKPRRNDPDYAYCLVGERPEELREGPAAEIEAYLLGAR